MTERHSLVWDAQTCQPLTDALRPSDGGPHRSVQFRWPMVPASDENTAHVWDAAPARPWANRSNTKAPFESHRILG
jgi:hypothetical protein